jgi:hypothetical protein
MAETEYQPGRVLKKANQGTTRTQVTVQIKNKSLGVQIFLACSEDSCILRLRSRFTAARE